MKIQINMVQNKYINNKYINIIKLFLGLIIFIISSTSIFAELTLDNWKVYTSTLNVKSVAMDSQDRIWLGTTGGLVIYDFKNSDTISINHINGLLETNISKLVSLPDKKLVMLGTQDGVLEIVNEDLEFFHITAIRDHNFPNAKINDIIIDGNTAFIAGGWGIVEFDIEQKIFTNTIEKIGDFQKNLEVNNMILENDTLWASTAYGIACTSLKSKLNIANNWTTYLYPNEETFALAKIAKLNDIIYINFSTHIYGLKDNKFETILKTDGKEYNNILDINTFNNQLLYLTSHELKTLSGSKVFSNWKAKGQGFNILTPSSNDTNSFLLSYNYKSLGASFIRKDLSNEIFTPNSPCVNNFMDLAINSKGTIYAVTDNSQNYKTPGGIMKFDGKKWTNYNNLLSDAPFSIKNKFDAISIAQDDKVYAGAWGKGLVIIDENETDSSKKYKIINQNNSPMTPFSGDFIIAGETAFEKNGRAWTVNYGVQTAGTMLLTYDQNLTKFNAFENPFGKQNRRYFNIAIDNYNTKWIYGPVSTQGIIYFNDNNTPENNSDDTWGLLNKSSSAGMPENDINCLAIDNFTSQIWVGTHSGIAVIRNPYAATTQGRKLIVSNMSFLRGQPILDIMVDVVGNKWIATLAGVFVINREGDDTLGSIKAGNSPLLTSEVNALAMNPENGLVYLGTKNGLYCVQTSILRPNEDYAALKTYPTPFNIDKDLELTIDGLVADTEIRILTPDGTKIRSIKTDSKRAIWDGRNEVGEKVPPGVYILIGDSTLTKNTAVCKIAVVE